MNDLQALQLKMREFFAEKLEWYKTSGDRGDFGRYIDEIVAQSYTAGAKEAKSDHEYTNEELVEKAKIVDTFLRANREFLKSYLESAH